MALHYRKSDGKDLRVWKSILRGYSSFLGSCDLLADITGIHKILRDVRK